MKYIHVKGQWCDIKYTPLHKRDNGIKFLKAIKKVQLTRAEKMETKKHPMKYNPQSTKWSRQNLLVNPEIIGLKIEIIH